MASRKRLPSSLVAYSKAKDFILIVCVLVSSFVVTFYYGFPLSHYSTDAFTSKTVLYSLKEIRSYDSHHVKFIDKFHHSSTPILSQSRSLKLGTNEDYTPFDIFIDPLVARIFEEEQEKDEVTDKGNSPASLTEALRRIDSGILESSRGIEIWRLSLAKGRSPIDSDFSATFDGSRSLWPPQPLFSRLAEALSLLQLPRLALRHPETIPTILRSILRSTIEYARLRLEENRNVEDEQSRFLDNEKSYDDEDDYYFRELHHFQDGNEDDVQDEMDALGFIIDDNTIAQDVMESLVEKWSDAVEGVMHLDNIFGFDNNFLSTGDEDDDVEGTAGADLGFGIQDGIWSHSGWSVIPALQKMISDIPELKDLMQELGRRPSAEEDRTDRRRFEKFAPRKPHPDGALGAEIDPRFHRESVTGITLSGNLSEMLPSEAVMLRQRVRVNEKGEISSNMLRRLFLAKMAESKLRSYELSGWTDVSSVPQKDPMYLNWLPSAPGGPIILCLDTSWSMSGNREALSKAVVLACVSEARKQGRDCKVISFSTERKVMESGVITADSSGIRRLLEFLSYSFGGGTDVTGALKFAIATLDKDSDEISTDAERISIDKPSGDLSMDGADILLVTDGEISDPPVPRDVMLSIEKLKVFKNVKIYGLLVGKVESKPLSDLCTDTYDFLSRYDVLTSAPAPAQTSPSNSIRRRERMSTTTLYAKISRYDDFEDDGYNQKLQKRNGGRRKRYQYDDEHEDDTRLWIDSVDQTVDDEFERVESLEKDGNKALDVDRINKELHLLKKAAADAIDEVAWTTEKLDEEREANGEYSGVHERLNAAIARVEDGLVERGEDARLVVLAMIANEHILLIGKPGTGKSVLGLRLAELCNGKFFQRLLTRFTTPEELFGPLSLKSLENDEYRRVTSGFLPTADVAFLDEIFKANSAILNTLLTILNERKFDNGESREPCPIRCVVGASNELPDSDELVALYDRFLIRKEVVPVTDEGVMKLLSMSNPGEATCRIDIDENCDATSVGDLEGIIEFLSSASDSILMDDDACELMRDMRAFLRENCNIEISDRRLVKATRLLKISAASDGRKKVDSLDFLLLQHCFWNAPNQRVAIREWLWDNLTPFDRGTDSSLNQIRFLLDNLRNEILSSLQKTNGYVDGTKGAKPGDLAALEALRNESKRISIIVRQRLDALARHMILVRMSKAFTWIEPDDATAVQQFLLPRAELLWPQMKRLAEDAEALRMAISQENAFAISNELRRDVIELLWEDGSTCIRDFTEDELQISMREAKSKYEIETFRRWKRAKKKYDKASH